MGGVWRKVDCITQGAWHVTEDAQGRIYVATWGGVCVLDGGEHSFIRAADGLFCDGVQRVLADDSGNLWIGTFEGLIRVDGRTFTGFTPENGLAGPNVLALYRDRKKRLWIGTNEGISCLHGDVLRNVSRESQGPQCRVYGITEDRDGALWFGTRQGAYKYDGSRFLDMSKSGLPKDCCRVVMRDTSGTLWLAFYDAGVFIFDRGVAKRFDPGGVRPQAVLSILEDRKKIVWFGSYGEIRYARGRDMVSLDASDRCPAADAQHIFQDRGGLYWFACGTKGLFCYDPDSVTLIAPDNVNESLARGSGGRFWWEHGETLVRFERGAPTVVARFHSRINVIFEDRRRRVWVSTLSGRLFRCDDMARKGPLEFRDITAMIGHPQYVHIEAVFEDRDGCVWIGHWAGIERMTESGGQPVAWIDGTGREVPYSAFHICQDRKGTYWIAGFHDHGLMSYDGRSFRRFTRRDGLPHNRVYRLLEDRQGRLWIGSVAGIGCYDGQRFVNHTAAADLTQTAVIAMAEDASGHLWFATSGGGVCRYDGREFQVLMEEDGLPGNYVSGLAQDTDGSMIIATQKGVCRYRPDCQARPSVVIREVDAERQFANPRRVSVPVNAGAIRIRYHGACQRTHRIRYRYKLEGHDLQWISTWKTEVRYENLPVGRYTFKVIAINRDLIESAEAAECRVNVVPDPRDAKLQELEARIRQSALLDPTIARTIHYISLHYADPITVHDICRGTGLSRRTIEKAFHIHLNLSPAQELLRCRLDKARELIDRSDQKLLAIALACGFRGSSHFCQKFRHAFGISPTAWRKKKRETGPDLDGVLPISGKRARRARST